MSHGRTALARTQAVGVVMPVHNEQELLGAALSSLASAFGGLGEWNVEMKLMVVLDACRDASAAVVAQWERELRRATCPVQVTTMVCHAKNVGFARRIGCAALLGQWSALDSSTIWLATTDADSRVPQNWLRTQVARHEAGVDLWSGRVSVVDWPSSRGETALRWQRAYEEERNPIHGTSMGFNAKAYLAAGGFAPLRTGEDRALHGDLVALGAVAYGDASSRVETSSRRDARAPGGFAHALSMIEKNCDLDAKCDENRRGNEIDYATPRSVVGLTRAMGTQSSNT